MGDQWEARREKERILRGEVDQSMTLSIYLSISICTYIYMYIHTDVPEESIVKSTKCCLQKGEDRREKWDYNEGGEFVQNTLFTF
jgi:hypothetical protein